MGGPPVYEDGFSEIIIYPSLNSLDNTFKMRKKTVKYTVAKTPGLFEIQKTKRYL
jgi:hypothetical protein